MPYAKQAVEIFEKLKSRDLEAARGVLRECMEEKCEVESAKWEWKVRSWMGG
ncbi:MAG: hypothetical protein HZC38_04375 [Chloroflexi bacterium]|nr:hypothetical protein [Chloroflexota bacterium]MBI5712645.1 hypothetical protein [Chloroflexota bacterium]